MTDLQPGYGYHADFINGWNVDTLQAAVNDCTNPSGRVEDCVHFQSSLQTEAEQGTCKIEEMPSMLANDDCDGPSDGLCGNVPIQYGPKYATDLESGNTAGLTATEKPTPSSISVPTLSYATARSKLTDKWGGGISVYNVKSEESSAAVQPTTSAAEPVITPSPSYDEAVQGEGSIIGTSTYTKDGVIYEIAIKEITVTVTEGAAKARRHAHAHRRRSG